ncbi:MAG: hypothetical protein ACXVWZ_11945 [Nocardioides sp.]
MLYDCVDQPFDYALDVPADTTYWALHVTLTYPSGALRKKTIVSPEDSEFPPHAGSDVFTSMCPSDEVGTFTLSATVDYSVYGDQASSTLPVSTFEARRPVQLTTARVAVDPHWARYVKGVTIHTATTLEQRDGTYLPVTKPQVYLQRLTASGWRTLGTRKVTTRDDGTGVTRFEWPMGTAGPLRAMSASVYDLIGPGAWSYSDPFTVEVPPGPNPFPPAQGWRHQRDGAKYYITRDGYAYFWTTERHDEVAVVFDEQGAFRKTAIQLSSDADKPVRTKFTKCGVRTHVIIFGFEVMDQRTLPAWPCPHARATDQPRRGGA